MAGIKEKSVIQLPKMRGVIDKVFRQMFDELCQAIEDVDGNKFSEKIWNQDESKGTVYLDRSLFNGNVFEKVGVNHVAIEGELPSGMNFQQSGALATTSEADKMIGDTKATPFFATGTSFVIHPTNPMTPTAHVNYRYFQIGDGSQPGSWWFGGGADLTPAYLFEEDAVHFHRVHKEVCDKHNSDYYLRFKKSCDEYFFIPHRQESRGIGGIFFDNLKSGEIQQLFSFVTDCAKAFVPAYIPIVRKRKDMSFTEEQKQWQRIVRGRYAEFILTSDRGIRFGLTSGMVNHLSIFNCMPPAASWEYNDQRESGTEEAMLKEVLKNPRTWL